MDPEERNANTVAAANRGAENYARGYSFEDRVAEAYRLLGYSVEQGRLFFGRQVDLFLDGAFGDVRLLRAIECKAGDVTTDDIDKFLLKLTLVKREYPAASGTMVAGRTFTDAVAAHAAAIGIQLTLYQDLHSQLIEGSGYARSFVEESRSNHRYRQSTFVEPRIGFDATGESLPAFEVIDEWMRDGSWRQCTLLGDVGTGKSFLARMTTLRLAKAFLDAPQSEPLPLYIDLRNADREFSLEGLLSTFFATHGLRKANFAIFDYLISEGQIVLVLDGFDEMASKVTPTITARNFHQLARCVKGKAKVLLTCRTHYFRSRTETEEVVLGAQGQYSSEVARDLFWDLIARAGFRIAYLRPFSHAHIEQYLLKSCGPGSAAALGTIKRIYNLFELSQRPLLLEMIVQSLDKLATAEVTTAELYQVFTDAWIHRDRWREVLTPDQKLTFLTTLARLLWEQDTSTIHYTLLEHQVAAQFTALLDHPQRLIELDGEVRTATFLTRDEQGNYGFAHTSYAEYFLARYLASQVKSGNIEVLATRRLANEVVDFLLGMLDESVFEQRLVEVLQSEYRQLLSENALACLYRYRRNLVLKEQALGVAGEHFEVELPAVIQLQSARLAAINLEGAQLTECSLDGADLQQSILNGVNLTSSSLRGALLYRAELQGAQLANADLTEATLTEANFTGADINGADFSGANLSKALILVSNIRSAKFTKAMLQDALLPSGIDLAEFIYEATGATRLNANIAGSEHSTVLADAYEYVSRLARWVDRSPELGVTATDVASDVIVVLLSRADLFRSYMQSSPRKRGSMLKGLADRTCDKYVASSHGMDHVDTERRVRSSPESQLGNEAAVDVWQMAGGDEDERRKNGSDQQYEAAAERDMELLSVGDLAPWYRPDQIDESAEYASEIVDYLEKILSDRAFRLLVARYVDGKAVREIAENEKLTTLGAVRELEKAREIAREALRNVTADLRHRPRTNRQPGV